MEFQVIPLMGLLFGYPHDKEPHPSGFSMDYLKQLTVPAYDCAYKNYNNPWLPFVQILQDVIDMLQSSSIIQAQVL